MERNFIKRLLDSGDPLSLKRFVTIIVSAHFIIASFVGLFITFYLVFYTPKGRVDVNLLGLLKDIIYYDVLIIGGGLGFITVENFGQALIEKAKILSSSITSPTVTTENIENVNVSKEPMVKDDSPEPDNPDK